MSNQKAILIVSTVCNSCARLLDAIKASPTATNTIQAVDINALTPIQKSGLRIVPTLVLPDGKRLESTQAFEYVHKISQNDNTIQPFDVGLMDGDIPFSMFGDSVGYGVYEPGYSSLK